MRPLISIPNGELPALVVHPYAVHREWPDEERLRELLAAEKPIAFYLATNDGNAIVAGWNDHFVIDVSFPFQVENGMATASSVVVAERVDDREPITLIVPDGRVGRPRSAVLSAEEAATFLLAVIERKTSRVTWLDEYVYSPYPARNQATS